MACHCGLCNLWKLIARCAKSGSRSQIRKLLERLYERALMAEEENEVNKMILDGTWPNSVDILINALIKAQKYEREHSE